MTPPTLAELAENVTPATLPDFLDRLHNRPEPHNLEYTMLILEMAGETLGRMGFSIFCDYAEMVGEPMRELAERLWKRSYPGVLNIKKPARKCVVIEFPMDMLKERRRGAMN